MNENLTEIVIVLDRSGSMQSIKTDMEGGLNEFFAEQKKVPGECKVTLTQFDTKYEVVYSGKDLKDVPNAKLEPRGGTALLDAVGRTINEVGARLAATKEADRPGKVLFLIITDGCENASREYKRQQIKDMIDHQSGKYSWQFVYLGANQDSFAEGGAIGILTSQNYTADSQGVRRLMSSVIKSTTSYRGGHGYTNK